MRKKFTMLLASLFLVVGTAWAENVLFNANSTTALPGNLENSQYTWKSSEMKAPDGFTTLRLTFMKNTNGSTDRGGYPNVNIAEFYLYDQEGNTVALTADKFSSNATETAEGKSGLHRLCDGTFTKQDGDGDNDWYWHSYWGANAGAYHYLEINVSEVEADLSTFAIGYVTRQENGSPTELLVTTGSSTGDVAVQCPNVTVTYNHLLAGENKKTEACPAVVGASYPAPTLPWGIKVVTDLSGTVTEGGVKNVEVTYNGELPFTPSENFETAHWYYLRFTTDARYIRYNEADTYIPTDLDKIYANVDPEAYAWAFVGDPYTGEYKLMNRKAGSTKVLSSTRNIYDGNTGGNTCPLMKEESGINEETDNTTWIVTKSTSIAGVNGMYIGLTTSKNETKYMNKRDKLAFWTGGQGDGSTFRTEEFSYTPAFVVAKEEALKSLQALAAISDKTEAAKTVIEALNPTTSEEALAAFTTLNEQMNSVVRDEYFTLQNKNNTSIYLTTDGKNASATTTKDIEAYWTLKNKNGLFYLYNKYNNAYLQRVPTSNNTNIAITSQENLAAAYRAVLPTDANNVWALTSFESAENSEDKFLHKDGYNNIVRWNAATGTTASHWTIAEVDYTAAFSALVKAQLEGKVFSDNPELGEYPTSAKEEFEALRAAYINNPTDENEIALVNGIDELEKAKNLPVFIIESMKDYALNSGIYEVNASTLKFKAKDEFDKTMWWSFDITSEEVSCTDRVVVRNVGSGNLFWGAEYVSVIETEPGVEGDGVFMFKTNGKDNPVHAQESGSSIVRWSSADANTVGGASTWKFSYIGSTYELSKFTDEYAAAYEALKTAHTPKSYMLTLFGDGIGQYSGDSEEFLEPLTHATELLRVRLKALLQNYDTQDIVDATAAVNAMQEADILTNPSFTLNLPQAGKYYRIKGANEGAAYYLTGNLTSNGAKTALQETADDATIFRYIGGKLLAVESNLYIGMINNFYPFRVSAEKAPAITFAASSRKAGAYTVMSDRYFYYNSNNTEGTFLDRCSSNIGTANHTAHDWYLEEVAESEVPANTNLLTDINNLSAEASYRIYGARGFICVADDGNMKGTNVATNVAYNPNNDKHHFAIVTIGENKYLYNVGAKKFVMKSGNGVTLTDWPEQAVTIEARTDLSTDYDWVIKLGENRLNLSTGSGNTYGVFTNYNTEDAGNVWAIYKVGTFDPAEAQSMKKVIVNYTIDGVAATETVGVAAGGTLNFSYDFATVTSCTVGEEAKEITDGACSVTIQDNVTISVAMTSDNRLFRLKNTASSKYMTIVTPEAVAGIQIKDKDKANDPVKQAFRIVLANWQGKYNIKSTENYFMASSGNWDYGAYKTANVEGRAHNVENLGEGKYALKTLNGYAGPNSGATADGSPLYSNHGAGNSGREWELEELPKSSITYIYKWNDQTIVSEEHENVYEGLAAPATAVTLPFGFSYDAASLPTTKGAGDQEVEIECTPSLPFQFADSYEAIETNGYWYYLKFDSNTDKNFYLYHTAGQNYIALDSKEIDKKNKDIYSWGFVGDPINGFKIVNKAAGNTMILSSSTTMTGETGKETWPIMTVEDGLSSGNNTYWIPTDASAHATNGFFLAQKDHPTHRMNNRDGKLAYWTGGANKGSTFVVEARPFGPVAELKELLIEAKELKAVVDANTGDKIGEYSSATATALANAITEAEAVTEATADDVTALENVVLGTKIILPTAGTYYQIHSALFAETKAVYSDGDAPMWKALNEYDRSFYWLAVETADGGIALKNVQYDKYMNGASNQSGAWTVSDTPSAIDVKILTKDAHEKGYQYGIILNNWQLHANGHSNGNGTSGSIVSYNTEMNNASAWYIVEVVLPEFYPVTYKFNFDGETKYTQEKLVAVGGAYPAMDVFLPYGVTSNFELPTGTVQEASEHVFNLTVNKALPFEAVAEGNTPSKWYYAQMHANASYTAYVGDDEGLTWWNNTHVETEDIDNYLWGFVGDLWTGYKMVNKATGQAIHSTGSGDATLVEASSATKFILSNSQVQDGEWFCLKYPGNTDYLNANANNGHQKIEHYSKNDQGSSIFITEHDKEYSLAVSSAGYSTYYSDYRLAIPETVEAYVVASVENREVVLEQVTGVLPAHTGVILKGVEGEYSFVTSAAATTEIRTNLLKGTTTKTLITPAEGTTCYVLANPADGNGVGLYKATLNRDANGNKVAEGGVSFLNNANKVYLPVETSASQAAPVMFSFRRGGDTTDIENSTLNPQTEFAGRREKQPSTEVYDLSGRRVLNPTKGMYIVNGKKVVIK